MKGLSRFRRFLFLAFLAHYSIAGNIMMLPMSGGGDPYGD
jgi:hypothetical protein